MPLSLFINIYTYTHTHTYTYIHICRVQLFRDPVDCNPPGSSVHGISQTQILQWVCHFFLQVIFLTQGLNSCLLHCRQILYHWATREDHTYICVCIHTHTHTHTHAWPWSQPSANTEGPLYPGGNSWIFLASCLKLVFSLIILWVPVMLLVPSVALALL